MKTTILKSSLHHYRDAYTLAKRTIIYRWKKFIIIFKDCVTFTNCISEINNTQVVNGEDIDVAVLLYN